MKRKGRYMHRGAPKSHRPEMYPDMEADAYDRILTAARPLFATFGYNGTSIRDITSAARVNVSAVGYYFTTKQLLYVHILSSIVGPLGPAIETHATKSLSPPLTRIEHIVRTFFRHFRANPDMPAFMVREMAEGAAPSAPIIQTMRRTFPALAGVIIEGQQDGSIRAGDPTLLALSTVAQPVYLYLARSAISAVTGVHPDDDTVMEHVVETVRAALEKR